MFKIYLKNKNVRWNGGGNRVQNVTFLEIDGPLAMQKTGAVMKGNNEVKEQ